MCVPPKVSDSLQGGSPQVDKDEHGRLGESLDQAQPQDVSVAGDDGRPLAVGRQDGGPPLAVVLSPGAGDEEEAGEEEGDRQEEGGGGAQGEVGDEVLG